MPIYIHHAHAVYDLLDTKTISSDIVFSVTGIAMTAEGTVEFGFVVFTDKIIQSSLAVLSGPSCKNISMDKAQATAAKSTRIPIPIFFNKVGM